jgi:hypothetical protein
MARTLFIIDDATLKSLGSTVIGKMMDEVKSIFAFAPKFTVLMTTPDSRLSPDRWYCVGGNARQRRVNLFGAG